jgi:hypothetical protein
MIKLEKISPQGQLKYLFSYCEKLCVADCCGINAFDFSPLHIASFLCSSSGDIQDSDISQLKREIDDICFEVEKLPPDENGFICMIEGTNQCLTKAILDNTFSEIRCNLDVCKDVFNLSEKLRKKQSNEP